MPLVKTNSGNPIRGVVDLTAAQRAACQSVIAMLQFADLGRGAGTVHVSGVARLDVQGRTAAGQINLQVQIGTGTAAAGLVSGQLLNTPDQRNQQGVVNGVISVLNQSLDSRTVWNLNGSLP